MAALTWLVVRARVPPCLSANAALGAPGVLH
jgi:hypothetical protein